MSEIASGPAQARDGGLIPTETEGGHGADENMQEMQRRSQELQDAGVPAQQALSTAILESRIRQWPPEWGDDLSILIYGDFTAPATDLSFADLGITVEAGRLTNTIITSAMCVLRARVTVRAKSVAGLADAAARINLLLGVLTVLNLGNSGCGWWSHVTHGTPYGVGSVFDQSEIERAVESLQSLPKQIRHKVTAALYWIREPRQMMREGFRSDVLRAYAGYWNAFECLVDAVCILRPPKSLTKKEKDDGINQFLADNNGKLDPAKIGECFRLFVDPGFVPKASHALRQCFPERADEYINECFKVKPARNRLYDIRNAINHGEVDTENPLELIRIDERHSRLWLIVFGILGQIISVRRATET